MGKPRDGFMPGAPELAGRIVPLRAARNRRHAELVRDVVDAFRRLHDSVARFVSTLMRTQGEAVPEDLAAWRFEELLPALEQQAARAGFGRRAEWRRAIADTAFAERYRDVIFAPSSAANDSELRRAASALERLDAAFVRLCVEQVLAHHGESAPAQAAGAAGPVPAARTALARNAN